MSERVREILEKGREAFRNTGNKYPFAYVAYHFAAIEVLSREVDALWKALDHTHAGLAPQAPPAEISPQRRCGNRLAIAVRAYLVHMGDEGKGPCTASCLASLHTALLEFENTP